MDKLVPGLILAAVSGITVLAYQHPSAYKAIAPFLEGAVFCLWMALIILDSALRYTSVKLVPYIKENEYRAASEFLGSLPHLGWREMVAYICLVSYLNFLLFLPMLLGEP